VQLLEQEPQLLVVFRLVSQPLLGLLSQSANGALQLNPQLPLVQVDVAFAALHALLHPPQCWRLLAVLVSQPLPGLPSQSSNGALQTNPQLDPAHVAVAFAGAAQVLPQPPQCCTLLVVSISQPFAGLPSQLA
jgi:hypothetical protein